MCRRYRSRRGRQRGRCWPLDHGPAPQPGRRHCHRQTGGRRRRRRRRKPRRQWTIPAAGIRESSRPRQRGGRRGWRARASRAASCGGTATLSPCWGCTCCSKTASLPAGHTGRGGDSGLLKLAEQPAGPGEQPRMAQPHHSAAHCKITVGSWANWHCSAGGSAWVAVARMAGQTARGLVAWYLTTSFGPLAGFPAGGFAQRLRTCWAETTAGPSHLHGRRPPHRSHRAGMAGGARRAVSSDAKLCAATTGEGDDGGCAPEFLRRRGGLSRSSR